MKWCLAACPFCGAEVELNKSEIYSNYGVCYHKPGCFLVVQDVVPWHETEETPYTLIPLVKENVDGWNMRREGRGRCLTVMTTTSTTRARRH